MSSVRWTAALVSVGSALGTAPRFASQVSVDELRRQLQPLVNDASRKYGTAYALALVSKDVSLELVAGSVDSLDAKSGSPSKEGDNYVWGSVTKTFTGAGVLQLVAAGKLKLDDPAYRYVDPMLKLAKAPYQSMEELFRAGRWSIPPAIEYNASDITVRHLLSMLSGIRDFDTAGYRDFQYAIPSLDVSPLQVFDWAHGPLMFKPGGPIANSTGRPPVGFNYCSVNFMLLGYILAYFSGAQNWLDYDQASVVPAALRARMEGLAFSKSGSCSKMTRVHGYDMASVRKPYDVSNISCLGGWTAGNVVMPTLAAAEWSRALWGPRSEVVPRDLVDEMVSFQNGSAYGLATMNMGRMSGLGFLGDYGVAVGHLGDTYGYTSIVTYFPKIDVAIAIATNHEDNVQAGPRALLCTAYNRALDIMLGRALRNCSYVNGGYFMGGCKCEAHSGAARAEILI